jgi:hypothetical protein
MQEEKRKPGDESSGKPTPNPTPPGSGDPLDAWAKEPTYPVSAGLPTLLVGAPGENPERLEVLPTYGLRPFGLWMPGSVVPESIPDLPVGNWWQAVRNLQPSLIYGLLDHAALPLIHKVMLSIPDVPAIWHVKDGPLALQASARWNSLTDVLRRANGLIFSSAEERLWYEAYFPGLMQSKPTLVLDGDLPPARPSLPNERRPLLSKLYRDGSQHTVAIGIPGGLFPEDLPALAAQNIHLHIYSGLQAPAERDWLHAAQRVAAGHMHIHGPLIPEQWVPELSAYDAAWLHSYIAENHGDIRRASREDLVIPGELSAYAAAGLPVLMRANPGEIVASNRLLNALRLGLEFSSLTETGPLLRDPDRMEEARVQMWGQRSLFTFDFYAGLLREYIDRVMEASARRPRLTGHKQRGLNVLRNSIPLEIRAAQPGFNRYPPYGPRNN